MRGTWLAVIVSAALAMPALAVPPPRSELVYDLRALGMVLAGDWYEANSRTGQPRPKSTFTLGIEACTAERTATMGTDFTAPARRKASGSPTRSST